MEFTWVVNCAPATIREIETLCQIQEGAKKDMERTFGVLQGRFETVNRQARSWFHSNITNILISCVISQHDSFHNMIIEEQGTIFLHI